MTKGAADGRRWFFVLVALIALESLPAQAQVVDATNLGESIELSSNWRFQPGDNLRWSRPDFDDSQWRVISTQESWGDQGVSRPPGLFWYRLRVKLPPRHSPLSIMVGLTACPYEVYINGRLVGSHGRLPPHEDVEVPLVRVFEIPPAADTSDITIAIRFFCWWRWESRYIWGGLVGKSGLMIGTTSSIQDAYRAWQSEARYEWLPEYSVRFVSILLAAGLLLLYRSRSQHREYLWIAAHFVFMTAWTFVSDFQSISPMPVQAEHYLRAGLIAISKACLLQFVYSFLRQSVPARLRWYQMSLLALPLVEAVYFAGVIDLRTADLTTLLWGLPYAFVIPAILIWRYIRGNKEAGFLIIPLLLVNLNDILNSLAWLLYEAGLRGADEDFVPGFQLGPIPVNIGEIANLLFVLSISAVLLHRFQETSREKERAHAELEAARSMQEVMVPQQVGSTPGFVIEAVYIPAQEVGGDFFRLFPGADGSLLVVIGDVSGKGVKAAMLVSFIVGLLQKIVERTHEPSNILGDLNASLSGYTAGRFATCCCALIQPNGRVRIANAGHLPPYCGGVELDMPGGVPLGVIPDTAYDWTDLSLMPNDRVVFLSDGVVEARSKSGEIYGFERVGAASTQPADLIAVAAQRFGQDDDITVLSVELQPVRVLA